MTGWGRRSRARSVKPGHRGPVAVRGAEEIVGTVMLVIVVVVRWVRGRGWRRRRGGFRGEGGGGGGRDEKRRRGTGRAGGRRSW